MNASIRHFSPSSARNFIKYLPLLILLFVFPVSAQEDEKYLEGDTLKYEIDEVTVLGTRTFERIIDIPYSVFRVDKKELSYGKKVSAKDVLADVPGLFLQSRYGNHDLRISIRGFGTRSNSGVRGVRILQDGIPESEPDGETVVDAVDFTSLGGVEVVKGNLSSLYANAPGGVINFISDLYFPVNYVTSTNQFGSYDFRQNGFKLGLQNSDNRLLLSYGYRNMKGFRVHSNEYQHLMNAVFEAYAGPKTTLTVLGNYVYGGLKVPGSLTKEEFDADPFAADPVAVSQDFRRYTNKGRIGIRYKTSFGSDNSNELETTLYGGIKEIEKAEVDYYTVATRYSLGLLSRLTNRFIILNRNNVLTYGMDYAYQAGPINEFENIMGVRGISVQNEYNESLGNLGFYVLDHYNILPELFDLFISARYDMNNYDRNIYIPYGFTDTTRHFNHLAPKIALSYKIMPSIALYTSYGHSADFPALSEMKNNPISSEIKYSINPDLVPQTSNNFEFGIKGNLLNEETEFMRKLFFEVTYFNYQIKEEIVPFIINTTTYFRNAAATNRQGIETGVKSEPFEGIELTVNYTYTKFKYKSYDALIYSPSGTTHEDYSGNSVPSVPQHILNFILNFELELGENVSGLLQWDCDYISKMYVDDKNSEISSGYFYGNAMGGLNIGIGNFSTVVYVGTNNIFNRKYAGYLNINDYQRRFYNSGEPRIFYSGLTLSWKL